VALNMPKQKLWQATYFELGNNTPMRHFTTTLLSRSSMRAA